MCVLGGDIMENMGAIPMGAIPCVCNPLGSILCWCNPVGCNPDGCNPVLVQSHGCSSVGAIPFGRNPNEIIGLHVIKS